MTALWQGVIGAEPRLGGWVKRGTSEVHAARLARPAWQIVAGSVARATAGRGLPVLVLVQGPERFADELRMWLAGNLTTYVFSEVGVSFLDRPPAFDESVNRRLEALAALTTAGGKTVGGA